MAGESKLPDSDIGRLLQVMARLRHPTDGCPWDCEQDFESIAPHTLEEAYEVADAIRRGDFQDLQDELGDLLFQVVYHARMAEEAGHFDFQAVVRGIADKLTRRHPHVFGDAKIESAAAQTEAWEAHKAAERRAKAPDPAVMSQMDGVSVALPAMMRAVKLQNRAARVGFDWPQVRGVMDKVMEELDELEIALEAESGSERVFDEMGDLLFACVNLARHVRVDPETALGAANARFEARFRQMETLLEEVGKSPDNATPAEMDAAWEQVKAREKH